MCSASLIFGFAGNISDFNYQANVNSNTHSSKRKVIAKL